MTDRTPILEVLNLSKSFPGVKALNQVSLKAYPGEVHALLGENGAGKSTLLKTIFGVQRPDAGRILVRGEEQQFHQPSDALEAGIAMVHQELSLVPQLSAIKNVVLGRETTRAGIIDWKEAEQRARLSLEALGFEGRADVPVRQLSVARQQLVELARALIVDAQIIILDEPTASLTTAESDQLFEIVRRLRTDGKAIVYVSHRLKEVLELADRITTLRDGELVASLARTEVDTEQDLVRLMVGREVEFADFDAQRPVGEEVLRVEGMTVPGVVEDVSLTLRRGEILCLAGMVGAGRTEFARAVIGADKASAGKVYVRGELSKIGSPRTAIEAGIALLPEDRRHQGLALGMSVASNVTLMDPPTRFGTLRRSTQRQIALDSLKPLNTKMQVANPVRTLSGGNQQKVVLARWLLSDSDIFIFDEPTRGIDVGAKEEIHSLMRGLADEGKGVLMISSDLPEVLAMSDRVLVMRRGQIVAEMDRSEMNEEAVVQHAAG